MRSVETTVYTFEELLVSGNTAAKEKARQWLRDAITDCEWWDTVYDEWKEILDAIGFEDSNINFSLAYCQGDYAEFSCKSVNLRKIVKFLSSEWTPTQGVEGIQPQDWLNYVTHLLKTVAPNPQYAQLLQEPLLDYAFMEVALDFGHCRVKSECDFWRIEEISDEFGKQMEQLYMDFALYVESLRKELCDVLYNSLQSELEGMTEESELIEFSNANDYTFMANGTRFG